MLQEPDRLQPGVHPPINKRTINSPVALGVIIHIGSLFPTIEWLLDKNEEALIRDKSIGVSPPETPSRVLIIFAAFIESTMFVQIFAHRPSDYCHCIDSCNSIAPSKVT